MKYIIEDLDEFNANVVGAHYFLDCFPELLSTGVEIEKKGNEYYLMNNGNIPYYASVYFSPREMRYLSEVVYLVKE